MDCSMLVYQNLDQYDRNNIVQQLIQQSNDITILWHNSQITHLRFYNYIIKSLLKSTECN